MKAVILVVPPFLFFPLKIDTCGEAGRRMLKRRCLEGAFVTGWTLRMVLQTVPVGPNAGRPLKIMSVVRVCQR